MPDNLYPTVSINGVEVFASGTHNGDAYTDSDLDAMVDAFPRVGFEPTAKAGHAEGQDDEKQARRVFGAPALGYVSRVYRNGSKLLADFKQVPRRFAELIKAGAYKRVSSEIYWNYKDSSQNKTFPRVLKSVAFLGAEIPALTSLKEVEALYHRNDKGRVYGYAAGREFRLYEMDADMGKKPDHDPDNTGYRVEQSSDKKWSVLDGKGKSMGEFGSQAEAQEYCDEMKSGKKSKYQDLKGVVHMTEQEVQEKIDAMKTEISSALTKQYEEKTAATIDAVKAEAETEKKALVDRIALLEKQSRDESEKARTVTIHSRLESLVKDGKVMPAERAKLKAVFSALPDAILHTYSDAEGKEVKEPVDETLWKIFESRKSSIFKEVAPAKNGKVVSDDSDGNPQAQVVKLAKEYAAADKDMNLRQAFAKVAEEHPGLWQEYQGEVKGSH